MNLHNQEAQQALRYTQRDPYLEVIINQKLKIKIEYLK